MIQITIISECNNELLEKSVNDYLGEIQKEGNKIIDIKYQEVPSTSELSAYSNAMIIHDIP